MRSARSEEEQNGLLEAIDVADGVGQRAIRGSAATVGGQFAQAALQLGSTIVLARLLTPEDFGLVAMVAVVTSFAAFFKDLGLAQAVVQREVVTHRQVSTLFWINAGITVALAAAVMLCAPLVALFYGRPELTAVTAVFGAFLVLDGLAVQHQAILNRQMRFGVIAGTRVAGHVAGVVAAIVVAAAGGGYWALAALSGVQAATHSALLWRLNPWRPGLPRRGVGVGAMLRFGGNLTAYRLATFFARSSDNVLIGWWWGAGPLGLYTKAYSLLLWPLHQLNAPLASVALPTLGRLQAHPERYRRAYLRMVSVSSTLGIAFVAFAAVVADLVIDVVLGPGWAEAAPIFVWLAVAGIAQPLTNSTGWLFVTQDRTPELLRWGVIAAFLTVAAFVVGLPFGPVGVAAAYGVSGLLLRTPLLLWYVGRNGPVSTRDLYGVLGFPLLTAGLIVAVGLAARELSIVPTPAGELVWVVLWTFIASGLLCWTTRPGRQFVTEVRHIRHQLSPRRR